MEALDGLPPAKVHCSVLAEEAIHAALKDYSEKTGIAIDLPETSQKFDCASFHKAEAENAKTE